MTEDKAHEPEEEQFDVILEDVEDSSIRPRKTKSVEATKKKSEGGWQYAGLAGQVGFDIALPMVLGLVVGTKLDEMWGTRPKVTLVLFFVGLFLGCASLIRIVRETMGKG